MNKEIAPYGFLSMIPADKLSKMPKEKRKELEDTIFKLNKLDSDIVKELKYKKVLLLGYKSFRYAANKFIKMAIKHETKKY